MSGLGILIVGRVVVSGILLHFILSLDVNVQLEYIIVVAYDRVIFVGSLFTILLGGGMNWLPKVGSLIWSICIILG